MPLSAQTGLNKLKSSNSAGRTSFNTGSSPVVCFKCKPRTTMTLRNVFGSASWANYFSFADYGVSIQNYDNLAFQAFSPIIGSLVNIDSIIYEATEGDGIIDAMTGNIVSGVVFLARDTFSHDLGNVPLANNLFSVQPSNTNTTVNLENGNKALNVIGN
jgi:hypothetical protein